MTINHLLTKKIKKGILIPLCIKQGCGYIRLRENGKEVWTDSYNPKKILHQGYLYQNLTGTICPYHLQEYRENKND